jgi:hypothetical protein
VADAAHGRSYRLEFNASITDARVAATAAVMKARLSAEGVKTFIVKRPEQ